MPLAIPDEIRSLLEERNFVHLSTLRIDGSPRNWVVWVALEDDQVLICTDDSVWKAKDMRRDPRVGLSVVDLANPYRMAITAGRAWLPSLLLLTLIFRLPMRARGPVA